MAKTIFISVVNDDSIYAKCILNNTYIMNNDEAKTVRLDNTVENRFISKRYNEFINGYDFSREAWLIFCHSDWEIREDISFRLVKLNKDCLYGPIGAIITDNNDGAITREFRGRIFDKKRDGTNERLMECDRFEDGALVDTFDCQCLIVHSSLINKHNLRFDENLEFDMYVEDFCIAAKVLSNIDSRILNINCCHWQQVGSIDERPHYFDKVAYMNDKYMDRLFGTVVFPIGGNSGVKIMNLYDIGPKFTTVNDITARLTPPPQSHRTT